MVLHAPIQPWIENTQKKNSIISKKQNLNLPHAWNSLHSIYNYLHINHVKSYLHVLNYYCDCDFQSGCPLMEKDKRLMIRMGKRGEFWQNMVHWRREWQTTSVFLPREPREQYEKSKR